MHLVDKVSCGVKCTFSFWSEPTAAPMNTKKTWGKKRTVSFSYFSFSSSKMDDMSAFIADNTIFILLGPLLLKT